MVCSCFFVFVFATIKEAHFCFSSICAVYGAMPQWLFKTGWLLLLFFVHFVCFLQHYSFSCCTSYHWLCFFFPAAVHFLSSHRCTSISFIGYTMPISVSEVFLFLSFLYKTYIAADLHVEQVVFVFAAFYLPYLWGLDADAIFGKWSFFVSFSLLQSIYCCWCMFWAGCFWVFLFCCNQRGTFFKSSICAIYGAVDVNFHKWSCCDWRGTFLK